MKIPPRLRPLADDGLIDKVLRQVKSGKEADVFVVRCGDTRRCAKVFKEANQRSFRQAAIYQEGRKERSTRRARAMSGRTRFGRKEQEKSWINAEVDALYTLSAAGVRVPRPLAFVEGVLLMELITDRDGHVAPRLGEVVLDADTARDYHGRLIAEVVRMLMAGLIHGDLSEFNILVDPDGPVVIDLPQAVDAAGNNNARRMLLRDVRKVTDYYGLFAPELLGTRFGEEIWGLFEEGELSPERVLTGSAAQDDTPADLDAVMLEIRAALQEEQERLQRLREADEED